MAKLRAIDKGTRYDVTGCLRKFIRRIENGELKNVTDVLVVARRIEGLNGRKEITFHHYGSASTEEIHWMVSTAKNRIEPA